MQENKKGMPVFVKIDEYKEVLDIMRLLRGKLDEAKRTLLKINDLKNNEDAELEEWRKDAEEIEKKIENIDDSLFEPEGY